MISTTGILARPTTALAAPAGQDAPAVVDLILGAGLLLVAALALFARSRQATSMAFLGLGVLMTLSWLRLGSIDVALAEAALGTGLLSALLVWLATRTSNPPGGHRGPRGVRRWLEAGIGIAAGAVISVAALVVWARIPPGLPLWATPLPERMAHTGVSHEVTGVLLAFRAYDTLLESAVLMFAGVAVLALGRDHGSPEAAPSPPTPVPSTYGWLVRTTAPALLLVVLWLLFVGSTDAGGAFQAGALLAGLLVLMHTAGLPAPTAASRWLRPLLVAGVIIFILAGLIGPLTGRAWLGWDPTWAFAAVLTVEIFLAAGIAVGLYLIYLTLPNPRDGRP